MENRDSKGRFTKGSIGNPKGRPKRKTTVNDVFESALMEAALCLIDLVHSEDDFVALKASLAIIERVLGKPADTVNTVSYNVGDIW